MNGTLRIVAGNSEAPRPAAGVIASLALGLRFQAAAAGLRVVRLEASRLTNSRSQYLHLADAAGRDWLIRISNHHCPRRTGHFAPHVDFVSHDGVSGFDSAVALVGRIARGEIDWWPPRRSPRRKGVRR